jgi:hypothetical protein
MSLRKTHGILVATSRVTNMLCRGYRRDPSEISRTALSLIWLRSLEATNLYGVANAYIQNCSQSCTYVNTKQRVLRCVLARARVFRARVDSSQLQRVHGFNGNLSLTLSELGLRTVPTSTT